jgi:hypothetical protein
MLMLRRALRRRRNGWPVELDAARTIDAHALASIGIDLDEVRRRVEESFGPGALDRCIRAVQRRP